MITVYTLAYTATILISWYTATSENPMKMAVLMTLLSVSLSIIMFTSTSDSWFPMVYSMFYLGGIIVTLCIIASIMPNQANKKSKMMVATFCLLTAASLFSAAWSTSPSMQMNSMKMAFYNYESTMTMLALILLYFFLFIMMVSSESGSLRSEQ